MTKVVRAMGSTSPYGWRVASDGERVEPGPEEKAARAVARQLRAEGLSLRGMAAELGRPEARSRTGRRAR